MLWPRKCGQIFGFDYHESYRKVFSVLDYSAQSIYGTHSYGKISSLLFLVTAVVSGCHIIHDALALYTILSKWALCMRLLYLQTFCIYVCMHVLCIYIPVCIKILDIAR